MATEIAQQDGGEEFPKATIHPLKLSYGVVSAGFLYNLKFSVQNNTKGPMRMRISCKPIKGIQNTARLVNLPDIVAPGLAATLQLELTAEFPMSSAFLITVTQNHSPAVYTKVVDVNVVSAETFRHVKKSLILQKRPIYQPNVTVVGNIPNFDTLTDDLPNYSSATFSEAVLLDDDDIDDLISLPMAHNIYWDPFAKCLRIDPKLGKVVVDPSCDLEENRKKTAAEREERLNELEEQGFLTINAIARMREDRLLHPVSPTMSPSRSAILSEHSAEEAAAIAADQAAAEAEEDDTFGVLGMQEVDHDDEEHSEGRPFSGKVNVNVTFSEDNEDHTQTLGSPSSNASRMSVTSLLAMKRERIERQRRESVMASSVFSENSKHDTKIDKNRTLTMIKGRSKSNLFSGVAQIPE